MKSEIVILGDAEAVYGFRLAGVEEAHILNKETKDSLTLDYTDKIILISEKSMDVLGEEIDNLRKNNVVQIIPGKNYQGVRELIRDTIGFDISS